MATVLLAFLGASLFGYLGAYFGALGKLQAEKDEREHLKTQLAENTRITQSIAVRLSREDFLGRRELEFRERQLSEFYGPVYGYLKSQKDIHTMWHDDRLLDSINLDVKKLFAEQNAIIRGLIVSKAHLIDSAEMEDFFVSFCTSTILFDIMAARTEDGMVPQSVDNDPRSKYPDAFDKHIIETTQRLKKRIQELHKDYAILPKTAEVVK